VAEACGVHSATVMRIRPELLQSGTCHPPEKRMGKDGKNHPAHKGTNKPKARALESAASEA
jgi:hypothetical protein